MKKYLLILIVCLSIFSVWPLFKNGYFESHDGEWMVIRFSAFHQTLSSGQFPVRFVDRLANNYGYPVINFLYPLPFYLTELWKLSGFGFIASVKITFILSTIFSAIFMFWALSQLYNKYAAAAGAISYIFIPYRFVDLYVRGSLGECLAFVFIPLIFGSALKIKQNKTSYYPILAISTASLILSHNTIALIFLPMFIIGSAIYLKNKVKLITAYTTGIISSSFFWLPALYDLQFVKFNSINVSNAASHLVSINKLILPTWGFGANPNSADPLSVQIGLIALSVLFIAFYFARPAKSNHKIKFLVAIYIATIFLMTTYSKFIWLSLPILQKTIQFPWRLLSLIVFINAVLVAFVTDKAKNKSVIAATILIGLSLITTAPYIKLNHPKTINDSYYSTNEDSTTVQNEYLPIWYTSTVIPARSANKIETKNAQIISQEIRPSYYRAKLTSNTESDIKINTFYFPGWTVKSDNVPIPINNSDGLINFKLPTGTHDVIIYYGKTPVHLASELASLFALSATVVSLIYSCRKQNSW